MLIRSSTILALSVCALGACDRRNSEDDFSQPKAVTNTGAVVDLPPGGVTPIDSLAAAANAGRVKRYPDAIALTPKPSTLVQTTTARTMPLGREVVAVFDNGGIATVLAQKGDWYLAMFPDPKDPSRELAGWVYKDGIARVRGEASVPGFPSTMACRIGEVQVLSEGLCERPCSGDADCEPVGGLCDGNSAVVAAGTSSIVTARYCIPTSSPP